MNTVTDAAKLPDDIAMLKQMILEILATRRQERRELADLRQRLDALLRRGRHG